MKTGYTEGSGYCLTATMKQDNMRIIAVAMGEPDSGTRNDEVSGMLDYAFAQYAMDVIYTKDSVIDTLKLDKSNMDTVDVIPTEDIKVLYKKTDGKKNITYDIKYNNIKDKISKGDIIGEIILKDNDKEIKKVGVTVNKDVEKASFIDLFYKYLKNTITGNIKIKKA